MEEVTHLRNINNRTLFLIILQKKRIYLKLQKKRDTIKKAGVGFLIYSRRLSKGINATCTFLQMYYIVFH